MSGFLGKQAHNWISEVRARDPQWFTLAEAVNDFSHKLLLKLEPRKDDGREIISTMLYKRVLSAFQAVVLLGERGMHTEALIQRRGMLEALFVLGAMWRQPAIVNDYIKNDDHRRRDLYKNIKKTSKGAREHLFSWISDAELDEQIRKLEAATKGIRYLSVEAFAQAAQLHGLYLTDYSILSEAAHHVSKDLERQLHLDKNDEIESLIWGPEPEEPFRLMFPTVDNMLLAIHAVAQIFSMDVDDRLKTFSRQLQMLTDEHAKRTSR